MYSLFSPLDAIALAPKSAACACALVGAVSLVLWYLQEPPIQPSFSRGQTVHMALDGKPAMVIAAGCINECEYRVRVASDAGYQELVVSEYELTR